MTLRSILTVLATAAVLTVPVLAGKSSVQLVVQRPIEPTTTYELRFDDAMIPPANVRIGITVDFMPTANPPMMFVACPVEDCCTIDMTGFLPIAV